MMSQAVVCRYYHKNLFDYSTLSTTEVEEGIASINATQIEAIAQSLIGGVMNQLSIDVEDANLFTHVVGQIQKLSSIKIYNPKSKLMEILLPICKEKIADSFSTPSEFVKNGIKFNFFNSDNNGLLDQIEDEDLKEKISTAMNDSESFSATIKADGSKNCLRLEIAFYKDEALLYSSTASARSFEELAKERRI